MELLRAWEAGQRSNPRAVKMHDIWSYVYVVFIQSDFFEAAFSFDVEDRIVCPWICSMNASLRGMELAGIKDAVDTLLFVLEFSKSVLLEDDVVWWS